MIERWNFFNMMQRKISKERIKRFCEGGNKIIHDKHEGILPVNVPMILADRALYEKINSTE